MDRQRPFRARAEASAYRTAPSFVGCLLALFAAACGFQPDETDFATASATSALEHGTDAADDGIENAECSLDAVEIARRTAASEPRAFTPKSCVRRTPAGPSVHAELDDCRGIYGRSIVSGGFDADFSVSDQCELILDLADSGDATANGSPFTYTAAALVTPGAGQRDVDWSAEWEGTTPKGRSIHNRTSLHLKTALATRCRTVDGSAWGSVDEHDYEIEVSELSVCPNACPTQGRVSASVQGRRREYALSITFDGSPSAHVVGWSGREFDVELDCEAGAMTGRDEPRAL